MTTECTTERLEFERFRRQRVVGRFDGGELGSDGGGLLLRELAQRTGLFGRLSACFRDYREPQRTRHPVEVLVAARVLGLALGYEDLIDHDTLRQSKLWSLLCGAVGRGRRRASWEALPPGKSTLNRLELTGPALDAGERYKKIVADTARLDALLVDLFLDWHGEQPERIVLDVDATDDPLHGRQEGRFFHGYYRSYCYLPLYIFCGQQLLGARLRTADRDAADGTVEELERIVGRIRKRWPGVEIWLRARSTRRCTARGAIWRTASRNSSWRCSPIAPRRRRCGPTSCACISPRSPTRCWSYCGAGACRARGWRGRNAARSA